MNSQIKLAAGDQEFEQAFFQLAYDKLQGKLSNLVPFLVGFQLVKKSDNDTKAVGVFGFKSNNGQILFVPAFFINGKIKELEILYSRNNNQFYPLNEDFAELFLKDDVTGLGNSSVQSKEEIQRDAVSPNLRNVIWPPRTGRISYAEAKDLNEQNPEILKEASEHLLSKKSYTTTPDVLKFVKESDNKVKEAFYELIAKNAEFTDALRSFYDDEAIADSLKVEPITKEAKESNLKVVDFETDTELNNLPEEVKTAVAKNGYGIIDTRSDSEISKVGFFKYTETFSNPTQSGFYPYITRLGNIKYGLVIMNAENLLDGYSQSKAIVLDIAAERKGQAYEVDTNKLFIKDQLTVKDFGKAMKLLEEPAEALPGYDDYILINENLKSSEPFRIIENYKDNSGIRRIRVEPTWYNDAKKSLNSEEPKRGRFNNEVVLVLTKKPGDTFDRRNHAVYIPKGFKLLKLHFSSTYNRDENASAGYPGSLSCLSSFLRENNTFPLTVHTNGSDYFLNVSGAKVKFANPVEAKIAMVTELGLKETDAEQAIENLIPNVKKAGFVKIAVTGEHILNLQDEQPTSNEFGQPTYYGVPWVDMYDGRDGYTGDPTQQGLGVKPDQDNINNTINHAVNLAQQGQKEIFDTQTIGALSKYTNSNDKVMEYVPNFVSCLDKLGRMLFLAYWDTKMFEDMYGKDELPELIELLKNVFSNLGDLVIFLKRKIPDLSINSNEQSKNDT